MKILFSIFIFIAVTSHIQAQPNDTLLLVGDFLGSDCKHKIPEILILKEPSTIVSFLNEPPYSVTILDREDTIGIKRELQRINDQAIAVTIGLVSKREKISRYSVCRISTGLYHLPALGKGFLGFEICYGELPVVQEKGTSTYSLSQRLCICPRIEDIPEEETE